MKKILSVLLASLLLLSTSATAFAMETETNADNWLVSANQHQIIHNAKIAAETGQNVTLTTKILSDLSDNHFELVEVGDTGYMIFDPQSGKYLEEALDSPSPNTCLIVGRKSYILYHPLRQVQNDYHLDPTESLLSE